MQAFGRNRGGIHRAADNHAEERNHVLWVVPGGNSDHERADVEQRQPRGYQHCHTGNHQQLMTRLVLTVDRRLGCDHQHNEQRHDDQIPAIERKDIDEHIANEHELDDRA